MKDSHEKLSKKGRASCGVEGFPVITTCRGMLPLTTGDGIACGNPLGHGGNACAGAGVAPAVVFALVSGAGWLRWQLSVARVNNPIPARSRMIFEWRRSEVPILNSPVG